MCAPGGLITQDIKAAATAALETVEIRSGVRYRNYTEKNSNLYFYPDLAGNFPVNHLTTRDGFWKMSGPEVESILRFYNLPTSGKEKRDKTLLVFHLDIPDLNK